MLLGKVTPEGVLYVAGTPPAASDPRVGGVCLTNDGYVHVSPNAPTRFDQGKGFVVNGALSTGVGPIVGYVGGLPVNADGSLVVQMNQTPAASDPFVGGIRVGPLGGIYITDGGGGGFTPESLFAAGEQGAWYDPSDFSTMFQDSAGTIPVTAVGQTVGKILDKSGNNNHATHATAAARPALQQDAGGKYYLAFDGVDDSLATASGVSAASQNTIFIGGRWKNTSNLVTLTDTSKWVALTSQGAGGTANSDSESTFRANTVDVVGAPVTTRGQLYDALASATLNKVMTSTKANISTWSKLSITGYGGAYNSAFRCYSLIVRGVASTTQEIEDTETWVNGKTNAY